MSATERTPVAIQAETIGVSEPLTINRDHVFRNQIVMLDDYAFVRCTFEECELRYRGGPVTFEETTFARCTWAFGGAAQRSIILLQHFGLVMPSLTVSQIPQLQ